ncbi:MAG: class II SORL domain-containing protein [Candidatus Thermoplasmatota archaeon]
MKEIFQAADWKKEKHVPVIELHGALKRDAPVEVRVSVGKEIPHPNTSEHHIAWIELYFLPQGEKFPYMIGRFDFTAHGASIRGPNTSTVYTEPAIVCGFKTASPGTLIASSYCNIHGLWSSSLALQI